MPTGESLKDIAPYPAAAEGEKRYVIHLPVKPHEENMKVELLPKKNVMKDPVNDVWFSGNLETRTLLGWGYHYYVIKHVGGPCTTLMGYDGEETLQPAPVHLGDKAFLRYNSRLPIVVYAPNDVILHYAIWKAKERIQNASEG